jgi:hypothetical protein
MIHEACRVDADRASFVHIEIEKKRPQNFHG